MLVQMQQLQRYTEPCLNYDKDRFYKTAGGLLLSRAFTGIWSP